MTDGTKRILVVDTETTGVNPSEDSLLEIAAVEVAVDLDGAWRFGRWKQTMVEYEGDIPPQARAVHHIAPEDVAPGAPRCLPRERAVGIMRTALAEHPITLFAAHNAAFDRGFLPDVSEHPWICTMRCAMHLWPDAPGYSNQVLRYWLGVEPPAEALTERREARSNLGGEAEVEVPLAPHRARYDAAVTAAILLRMLESRTPEELLTLTSSPVLLKIVRFGKHRGTPWSEVPRDYIAWMRRSGNWRDDADVSYTIDHYLS